jgi:hypothetical protein
MQYGSDSLKILIICTRCLGFGIGRNSVLVKENPLAALNAKPSPVARIHDKYVIPRNEWKILNILVTTSRMDVYD